MSEDEYKWTEIWRRMDKVERATEAIPVMARDITEIKSDVHEVRIEARSLAKAATEEASTMKRGLYTLAFSVMGGSVLFAISVFELFK